MNVHHDFHNLTLSTQRVLPEHDICMKTIAVKGKSQGLTNLENQIIGIQKESNMVNW